MNQLNYFVKYDLNKLESLGFNNSTLNELILELENYLTKVKEEFFIDLSSQNDKKSYTLEMLHKLEGALHYLALTGPIDYIKKIRLLIRSTPTNDIEQLVMNLFQISHDTLTKLTLRN